MNRDKVIAVGLKRIRADRYRNHLKGRVAWMKFIERLKQQLLAE